MGTVTLQHGARRISVSVAPTTTVGHLRAELAKACDLSAKAAAGLRATSCTLPLADDECVVALGVKELHFAPGAASSPLKPKRAREEREDALSPLLPPPVPDGAAELPFVVGSAAFWQGTKAAEGKTWKWAVYVRGLRNESLADVVESVEFSLHTSFADPVRTVARPPFELHEVGWGQFVIAIKVLFRNGAALATTHLLRFASLETAPPPPHCIPPDGAPFVSKEQEALPMFTPSTVPVVHEIHDTAVFPDPSPEWAAAVAAHAAVPGPDRAAGVSMWDAIAASTHRGAPPSEEADLQRLAVIRRRLEDDVQRLERDLDKAAKKRPL